MSNSLKIFYQNTRGLRTKIGTGLKDIVTLRNYHLLCLTETWLSSKFDSEAIFDDDAYVTHRSDRSLRTYSGPNSSNNAENLMGGGALIAIKRNISAVRMKNWEMEVPFDNVWLKINTVKSKKIFINCIYINPQSNFDRFNSYLQLLQDIIISREPDAQFVIIGDFNLSSIEWFYHNNHCIAINYEGRHANELLNTITLTNTAQINNIKNHYNRILDLTLTNITGLNTNIVKGIVNEDLYHPAFLLHLNLIDIKFMKSKKTNKYNFFRTNYTAINNALTAIDWNNEFNDLNVNESTDKFYSIIRNLIHKYTPIIKSKSDEFPKWFSKELIELIKQKEIYFNLKKKTKQQIYILLFNEKRKEIKRLKRKNLHEYQTNIESLIKTNPKCFFAYTKAQRKSNKLPTAMHLKNETSENMCDTANLFAKHFSSVYTDHNHSTTFQCDGNCNNYIHFSDNDLKAIINNLDSNKTNSPDGIPSIFYIQTIDNITQPLTLIFNKSFREMVYPDPFKTSFIIPIHKSGCIDDIENYRPISILSTIAKIFDKLIFNHISSKTAHLISRAQHGFTPGRSTITNLMEYTEYLTKNMMKGGQIDAIYMDLAKAFDRINHMILANKLRSFPISPCLIALILSYLSNRKQFVCLYGERSECITPKSSVPQGSILSPLLFALFINDLPELINTNILLFADDLKLFTKINCINDAHKLQSDINVIHGWCERNDLQLNRDKCYSITFTRKHEGSQLLFNYSINNAAVNRVNIIRDLGVIFDSKLKFEAHYQHILNSTFRMLGFISRSLYRFRKLDTYITLYNSYIRSIAEYCASIWSPYYQTHIDALERIQKKFTRIIFRKFHYPYESYDMRLKRLELLSLENRRNLIDELNLYKLKNGMFHLGIPHNFEFMPVRHTRNNQTFYLPLVTTNVEFHSPLVRMHRYHMYLFNNVDLNEPNFNAFKRYAIHEIKSTQRFIHY